MTFVKAFGFLRDDSNIDSGRNNLQPAKKSRFLKFLSNLSGNYFFNYQYWRVDGFNSLAIFNPGAHHILVWPQSVLNCGKDWLERCLEISWLQPGNHDLARGQMVLLVEERWHAGCRFVWPSPSLTIDPRTARWRVRGWRLSGCLLTLLSRRMELHRSWMEHRSWRMGNHHRLHQTGSGIGRPGWQAWHPRTGDQQLWKSIHR